MTSPLTSASANSPISTIAWQKPWVVANWKMNPTHQSDVAQLLADINNQPQIDNCNIVVTPSFLHLSQVKDILSDNSTIKLAAQNLCAAHSDKGAFTGEVSATQLADIGVEFVIIGHSERRQYYQETNDILANKIANAFAKGLSVIFCVGETLEQYKAGDTFHVIKKQLEILTTFAPQIPLPNHKNDNQTNANQATDLTPTFTPKLFIAYEPVWAIGTGLTPTLEEIEAVHNYISELLSTFEIYAPILYGGSVNEKNASDIAKIVLVDGVLVGGASLKADSFYQIIYAFAQK